MTLQLRPVWAAVTSIRAGTQTVPGLYTSLVGSTTTATAATVTTLYMNLLNRAPVPGEIALAEADGLVGWFQTLIGFPAYAIAAPSAPPPTSSRVPAPSMRITPTGSTSP